MNQQPTAAILLSDVEQSAELAIRLASENIAAEVATGSDDLYRLLYHRSVDLVVIADLVSGFLSGIEILEKLHNDALVRPMTILIAANPAGVEERAARFGVNSVLPAGAGIEALITTAKSLIVLSPGCRLGVVPEAHRVARQFDAMPLPELARKMFGYLRDVSTSTTSIAQEIATDPKATSGLLRITNSAALGLKCKVTNVADAVNLLGTRRAASFVLRALLTNSQDGAVATIDKEFATWFRQRMILTACVASSFASRIPELESDSVYVYALLQDVGILAMAQAYGRRYLKLIQRMQRSRPVPLDVAENHEFEISHAHVSAAILERWSLPESFVALALHHHPQSTPTQLSALDEKTLRVMRIGEAVAGALVNPNAQSGPHLMQTLQDSGFPDAHECRSCVTEALRKMVDASRLFSFNVSNVEQLKRQVQQYFGGENATCNTSGTAGQPSGNAESPDAPTGGISSADQTSNESTAHSDPNVLVVDDEIQFLRLVQSFLTPVGLKTVSVKTIPEAMTLAPGAQAILCDVHLAGEDGRDFVRALKQAGSKVPVIMISGDCTRKTIEDCVNLGIDDFLIKPFSPLALLAKIEKHTGLLLRREPNSAGRE